MFREQLKAGARHVFLDLQGDIVQAEFSGKGTLSITLDPRSWIAT